LTEAIKYSNVKNQAKAQEQVEKYAEKIFEEIMTTYKLDVDKAT
jgi:uncharacterized membrane-anchored protein YjiN (DUF445 family)